MWGEGVAGAGESEIDSPCGLRILESRLGVCYFAILRVRHTLTSKYGQES